MAEDMIEGLAKFFEAGRRMGMTNDAMADQMLEPMVTALLGSLPADVVRRAFERGMVKATAKLKATN